MAIEDLHWIDSASEKLLYEIVTSTEPLQLMIVHTRRPEYRPPWSEQPSVESYVTRAAICRRNRAHRRGEVRAPISCPTNCGG